MSQKFDIAAKTATLKNRPTIFEFKAFDKPANSVSLIESIKNATAAHVRHSNVWTIDVFPDSTSIHMFIELNASQHLKDFDERTSPKVSLATFTAYCTALYYGFILANDMYVRPTPSPYALDYHNDYLKSQFSDFLLSLPVPMFMNELFAKLSCTTPETTPHIVFCPSAAGFRHSHYYGTFVPINFYTNIHDTISSLPGNSNPRLAMMHYLSTPIFTIGEMTYTPAHLLGCSMHRVVQGQIHTHDYYVSRRRQCFDTVFNPTLLRDYQRRKALAPIDLQSPVFTTEFYNPYDMFFGSTLSNLSELKILLTSVASAINGALPISGSLASKFDTVSGSSILTHGYSIPRLPHYHHMDIADTLDPTVNQITYTKVHSRSFATHMHWLQNPALNLDDAVHAHAHQINVPCDVEAAPDHIATIPQGDFNLLLPYTARTAPTPALSPTSLVAFDESLHVAPDVKIICIGNDSTVNAWMTTCFGMVVRSFEIDGTSTSFPDPNSLNGLDNVCFADSALSMDYAIPNTHFDGVHHHQARARSSVKNNVFKSAIQLIDFSRTWIPRPLRTTIDNLINHGFPGLTFFNNCVIFQRALSFIGIRTASPRYPAHERTTAPHTAQSILHAWSPYTYTPDPQSSEVELGTRFAYTERYNTSYFIMNPRTMFGTTATICTAHDIMDCLPI